jgi:RES domain-containing protein
MRVIIAGSRTITDMREVEAAIRESWFDITEVVCGDARGVDSLGMEWAWRDSIPVKHFPADWNRFGKSAGYKRNVQMAEYAEALIAVTTGSRGTQHMIDIATARGLKVFVRRVPSTPEPPVTCNNSTP